MGLFKNINSQLDQPAQRHPMRWWHLPLLIILIAGTVLAYYSGNRKSVTSSGYMQSEGSVFGTIYHITYDFGSDLTNEIDSILAGVDQSLSPFNPNSIITAINNNGEAEVDGHFVTVFNLARQVNKSTNGAFDITVAPLVNAWGFGFKNKEQVTDSLINELLVHVGMEKVSLKDKHIVKSDSLIMLDCSAIAKGYGVDAVGQFLEEKGIKDYMVEIGGEVRLRGQNPKSEQWNIGINKPDDDSLGVNRELQDILHITNIAMATSGNYRNFYEEGNKKYAHTINPHTGYPAQQDILSSTVLAQNCAIADAFATAFMVMGSEEAKRILARHPEIMAYFICSGENGEYEIWYSDRLKKYLK